MTFLRSTQRLFTTRCPRSLTSHHHCPILISSVAATLTLHTQSHSDQRGFGAKRKFRVDFFFPKPHHSLTRGKINTEDLRTSIHQSVEEVSSVGCDRLSVPRRLTSTTAHNEHGQWRKCSQSVGCERRSVPRRKGSSPEFTHANEHTRRGHQRDPVHPTVVVLPEFFCGI